MTPPATAASSPAAGTRCAIAPLAGLGLVDGRLDAVTEWEVVLGEAEGNVWDEELVLELLDVLEVLVLELVLEVVLEVEEDVVEEDEEEEEEVEEDALETIAVLPCPLAPVRANASIVICP